MPSPFPGMDPWLEHPAVFPDLHDSLIAYLREDLNSRLPEPYYAGIASRVWLEAGERHVEPDVDVVRTGRTEPEPTGGVAVADAVTPVVVHVPLEEFRQTYLEVYARPGGETVVTTIEVLSLSNKTPGRKGRKLYRKKQEETLNSRVHLVEIDLLRGGRHTTAVPRNLARERAGEFDYHVCVHRFDKPEDFLVYPIRMQNSLPSIEIPLLPESGTVPVDLQILLDRSYDAGLYQRRVRYGSAPVPALSPDQAKWADDILKRAGVHVETSSPEQINED